MPSCHYFCLSRLEPIRPIIINILLHNCRRSTNNCLLRWNGHLQNKLRVCCLARWAIKASMTTNAAIASTIGTSRGTTHGSCLPLASKTPPAPLSYVEVCWACPIVAGGLNPTRKYMCALFVIPPWIPPELFVFVVSFAPGIPFLAAPVSNDGTSGARMKGSLYMEPGTSQPPNPEPISNVSDEIHLPILA